MEPQEELEQLLARKETLKQELKARKKELQEAQRRQRDNLQKQIRRAQARLSSADRKQRTRRLILLGSYLEHVTGEMQPSGIASCKGSMYSWNGTAIGRCSTCPARRTERQPRLRRQRSTRRD